MQFGSGLVLEAVGLVWCSLIDEHSTSWFGLVWSWFGFYTIIRLNGHTYVMALVVEIDHQFRD